MPVEWTDRPAIRLALFGGPELTLPERREVSLSPLQSALIGVLGAAGLDGVSRGRLIHLLWNENPDARTRHRLSQLLYALSEKTGSLDPFDATSEQVRLDPEVVVSDMDVVIRGDGRDLDALICVARRSFLSRLRRVPTRTFEDWLHRTRATVRSEIREVATSAWAEFAGEARWKEAEQAAHLLLTLDPTSEEALRRLMRARGLSDQTEEAVAAVASFRERWMSEREEGSWEPSPETLLLMDRLRELEREPEPPPELKAKTPPADPPFCGRRDEVAALTRLVTRPPPGDLVTICVTGDGGMGKTRLVSEGGRAARLQDHRVLRGGTTRFERDIPLNLLLDALDREFVGDALNDLGDPWRSVLLSLMPQFHREDGALPDIPTIKPDNIPRRMYQAVHRLVEAIAEPAPLLLFLDDFQWADETSVAALEFLRRRWSGRAMTLILGFRPERLGPRSPAMKFADELLAENDSVHIPLEELDIESADGLVQETAETMIDPETRRRISSLGGMNPFFLIELTHEYLNGRLTLGDQKGDREVVVPVSIRQVLERRFEELTDDDVHLLEFLTVHDRPLPWSALPEIAERSQADCAECIERLQAVRLVQWTEEGLAVRHELIRHAAYGRMSRARQVLLHERVARGLLRSDGAEHPDELALHFDRARIRDEALRFSMEAADRAGASGGVTEAIHFLTMARRNTDDPEAAAVIVGQLGHLHYLHRNLQDAAPLLELAAVRFREQGSISRALTAEVERIDALSRMESLPLEDFLQELTRVKGEARGQEDWETLASALDVEVHALDRRGDVEGVRRVLDEVEEIADQGSAEARCAARTVLAMKIFYGSETEALQSARSAVTEAKVTANDDQLLRACSRLIIVLLHQGLLGTKEGRETIRLAETLAKTTADRFLRFNQPLNRGVWHLDLGEYDRASNYFREAQKIANEHPSDELDRNLLINVAELCLYQRKTKEASAHFAALLKDELKGTPVYVYDIAHAGLGLCHLYEGRLNAALKEERALQPKARFWTFDRYLITALRAQILRNTRGLRYATESLMDTADQIQDRFVLSGVKMRIKAAELMRHFDPEAGVEVADSVFQLATGLGLQHRIEEANRLKKACERKV